MWLFLVIYLFNAWNYVFSINSHKDGYKTFLTWSIRADLRVIYGDCKKITTNTWSDSYFIPTKHQYEWDYFNQYVPTNLSVEPCISGEFIGEIWKSWRWNNNNMPEAHFSLSHYSVDKDESILITDPSNNVVKKYSSWWELLLVIGDRNNWDNNLSGTAASIGGVKSAQFDGSWNIWISLNHEASGIQYSKIKKYTSNGAYLLTIGDILGDNNLSGTAAQIWLQKDLVIWFDNTVYVTLNFPYKDGTKVKRYSSSGEFISEIWRFLWDNNLSGTAAEFFDPNDVVVDKNENVYVYDGWNRKIKIYSKTGTFLNSYPILYPVEYFNDMTHKFQEHPIYGVISLEEWLSDCIVHYTQTGSQVLIGDCSKGVGADELLDGVDARISWMSSFYSDTWRIYLYGSDYSNDSIAWKVYVYSLTGSYLFSIGDGTSAIDNNLNRENAAFYWNNINGITVDKDGNIYLLWENRIKKYNSSGDWILNIWSTYWDNNLSWESAQFGMITHITTDSSGNLFVWQRDYYPQNCKIKKYSSTWAFLLVIWDGTCWSNKLSGSSARLIPEFLRITSNNYLYVIDYGSQIKVYSSTGLWISDIGWNVWNNKLSWSSAAFWFMLGARKSFDFTNSNTLFIVSPEYNIVKEYSLTGLWLQDLGYTYWQIENTYSWNQAEIISFYWWYNTQPSLRVDRWGSMYIHTRDNYNANYESVRKFSQTGWLIFSLTGSNFEWYNLDMEGNIYRVLYGQWDGFIDKFNSWGVQILRIGWGAWGDSNKLSVTNAYLYTSQVSIDGNWNIYSFPDFSELQGKIKKYSSWGVWMMSLGWSGFYSLNDESWESASWGSDFRHFVSPNGVIYIEKFFDDSSVIKVYSPNGDFIRNIGNFPNHFSNDLSSTAALIYSLSNIHFDDYGNIYTVQFNGAHPSYDSSVWWAQIKRYDIYWNHTLTIGSIEYGPSNNESGTWANLWYLDEVFSDILWNIYSLDWDTSVLKKYNPDGIWQKNIWDIGWPFTVDKYGNYYKTNEDGNIESYDSIDDSFRFLLDSHDGSSADGSIVTNITQDNNYIFVHLWDFSVAIYDIFWNYYTTIGQRISWDNQLSWTQALLEYVQSVRIDSLQNLWIGTLNSDYTFSVIKQYSITGTYIKTLGSGILWDNILSWDAASWWTDVNFFIDNNDRIIIVDIINFKLKTYTSSGTFIESIWSGISSDTTLSGTWAGLFLGKSWVQSYFSRLTGFIYLYDTWLNKIKIYWP